MKRIMAIIVLGTVLSVGAKAVKRMIYDIRSNYVDQSVLKVVQEAQDEGTFDELPQSIKTAWERMTKNEYDITRDKFFQVIKDVHDLRQKSLDKKSDKTDMQV